MSVAKLFDRSDSLLDSLVTELRGRNRRAMAVVCIIDNEGREEIVSFVTKGGDCSPFAMVGALEVMKREFMDEIERDED